jgi:hypothetical protein
MHKGSAESPAQMPPLLFVLPAFDDWPVLAEMLAAVDALVAAETLDAEILVVDDGSDLACEEVSLPALATVRRVRVLELRRNMGHQRALAVALAFAHEQAPERTLVIMDADGEDDPADVPLLLRRHLEEGGRNVVFAARRKRSETLRFQLGYRVYQLLHRLLTGQGIRIGNFSVVPPRAVARLVVTAETWSHYAAAVLVSRVPRAEVATDRAQRLDGRSKMNFTSLVVHGLSALSVYSHVIGVRLLVAVMALLAASGGALSGYLVLGSPSGWLTRPMLALLASVWLLVLLQAMAAATLFVFILLSGRQSASVLPLRDYGLFVHRVIDLAMAPGDRA